MAKLPEWKSDFLRATQEWGILKFGSFKLKSGRCSPFFFNTGLFSDGLKIQKLAKAYATAIVESGIAFDGLFGPAYKGITLVTSVAMALHETYGINVPFYYNRKEIKDHGEGGTIVGNISLLSKGARLLIIDDVITSGASVQEALQCLTSLDWHCAAVVIALDRQEKMEKSIAGVEMTASNYLKELLNIKVIPILLFTEITQFLRENADISNASVNIKNMEAYNKLYGVVTTVCDEPKKSLDKD